MKILTLNNRFNIPAFLGGILILYVVLSKSPWWVLEAVGERPTFSAYVSPYLININILGKPLEAPILYYAVVSGFLVYTLTGITCIIGAFYPKKRWSKTLIGFRGFIIPLFTTVMLYITLLMAKNYLNTDIPIVGRGVLEFSISYGGGDIHTYTTFIADFTNTYYIAVIAGILTLVGRLITGAEREEGT